MSAEKVSLSAFCIAARCSAGRSNALRTSAGAGRGLQGLGEAVFRLAVHLSQAAREHLAQAFFQTRRGEIRQRLSRDGKHFLLGPASDGLIEVMRRRFSALPVAWRSTRRPPSALRRGAADVRRSPRPSPCSGARRAAGRTPRSCAGTRRAPSWLRPFSRRRPRVPRRSASPAHRWRRGWACTESASSTTPG